MSPCKLSSSSLAALFQELEFVVSLVARYLVQETIRWKSIGNLKFNTFNYNF